MTTGRAACLTSAPSADGALAAWNILLFASEPPGGSPHLSTRQYARIVHRRVATIGLGDTAYGTHTMRRTKASPIYRRTKNLRAVQLLLGHSRLESTVRYLGIDVDVALEMSEQTDECRIKSRWDLDLRGKGICCRQYMLDHMRRRQYASKGLCQSDRRPLQRNEGRTFRGVACHLEYC